MLISNSIKIITIFGLSLLFPLSGYAANDSSQIKRIQGAPQKYVSYVNTEDCVTLQSSAIVIVLGNGGGKMDLTCPQEKPVMYNWKQEVGYGGIVSVSSGGGDTKVTCCAVGHKWVS